MLEEEELKNAILMVLANKQDIPGCLSLAEVHKALGLEVRKEFCFILFFKQFLGHPKPNLPNLQNLCHQRRRAGRGDGMAGQSTAERKIILLINFWWCQNVAAGGFLRPNFHCVVQSQMFNFYTV